jgi:hypothetical protein
VNVDHVRVLKPISDFRFVQVFRHRSHTFIENLYGNIPSQSEVMREPHFSEMPAANVML